MMMKEMRMCRWICLGALSAALVGCGVDRGPKIAFTLSSELGDRVDLYLDESEGEDLEFNEKEGRYELFVPSEGSLKLKSLELFARPHRAIIAYEDGSALEWSGANPLPDREYWWAVGETVIGDETTRLIFAIGTPDEIGRIGDVFAVE
jgi:hypothetical protein